MLLHKNFLNYGNPDDEHGGKIKALTNSNKFFDNFDEFKQYSYN